jgi:HAE1 family hydrophobic/amphiphilic exporter-1
MIFLGIALMGIISWTRIPQELFPSMEYPQITIVTKYEGAGPEEAEKLISKTVEETVGTAKSIKKVSSVSREGISIVTCEFRWGTNMDLAAMEVREKIDLIKESLPRDANEPIVLKYNPMQVEAMILSVSYTQGEDDPWKLAELRQFCKKNIKDELERLDGVAKVDIRGGEKKEVLVEIDKGRLLANQVSITDVISSLRDANITYPAGTIKEDTFEYLVKTVGEFQCLNDIAALSFSKADQSQSDRQSYKRIRNQGPARTDKIVYIRDIADVKESLKDRTGYSRYNEKDNISLGIFPQSGSNLIKISKAVNAKLKDLKPRFPANVEVKVIYDQSVFVQDSLNNIYGNALQGAALSFILLYLFMKSMFASIIINTAIPVTMLVTLILMYFNNITINSMSLGGLTIGIGMVVDNSNVVLENILVNYHKNPNRDKKDIIHESTTELISPIISSTLTTVAIFLPFIFVTGMAGQLFKQLALTITFSMIASIFVAIFLVPRLAMSANLEKQSITAGKEATEKYFVPALTRVLRWPLTKMSFFILLYVGIGLLTFLLIPKEFMPKEDEHRFVLNISMSPETPLAATNDVTRRIEKVLSKYPEIKDLSATVGSTDDTAGTGAIQALNAYQARITAQLTSSGKSTSEIVSEVSDEMRGWGIEGLETEFITQQGLFGSSLGASSGITIEVKGKDLAKLRERATEIKNVLNDDPNFYGIKINPSDLVPELKVMIDRERASLFGLSTQDISAMSLAAIKGYVATKLKLKDDEFDIRVRLRPEDRDNLEKVTEMTAYSPWGMTIQLKQVSQPMFVKSLPEIKRSEGERTYIVTSNIKGNFSRAVQKLRGILDDLPQRDDITAAITGEMLAMRESMNSSVFAIVLGIVIIFMILASQFESLVQPVIIMTAVPLGIVGAVITLFCTFNSINSISMLGMIMLVGNVVSISIMLVDRYNFFLGQKENVDHATIRSTVIHATAEHLRPIMMTTLTTIIDLLPLALGLGSGGGLTAPMAITVVGGLTFALVMALFFVPYIYLVARGVIRLGYQEDAALDSRETTPEV